MLEAKSIVKSYGTLQVLKEIDLHIKKGEIVSIVGASGAGKSTLLQIIGTLDRADGGYIMINGVHIEGRPTVDLKPVNWSRRLFPHLIDQSLIGFWAGLILSQFEGFSLKENQELIDLLILPALFLAYMFTFEAIFGRTIGKMLFGTKVIVKTDGSRPTLGKILGRTMTRLIPWEFVSFLSKYPEGLHDSISDTQVVDNSIKYKEYPNSISDRDLSEFRNKNIGFIFQFHNLLPEFTAVENVCLPGFIKGSVKEEVEERAKYLLGLLGLSHRMDHKPSELSGGEQQRVAIARALINNPAIIFADEPSGNLDSNNAEELHKLFFKLREDLQQTFVIVTHNAKLADMADRKLEIRDGKIIS
jgi:ABC-type lipoprotein export system ATPase subunit